MAALRPLGVRSLNVAEEDSSLAASASVSITSPSVICSTGVALIAYPETFVTVATGALSTGINLASAGLVSVASSSALGTTSILAAPGSINLASVAIMPYGGLTSISTSISWFSPPLVLTAWPNLRANPTVAVNSYSNLSAQISLAASSSISLSGPWTPQLTTSIQLGSTTVPPSVSFATSANLVGQSFFTSLNSSVNWNDAMCLLSVQYFFNSLNNAVILNGGNAILDSAIQLVATGSISVTSPFAHVGTAASFVSKTATVSIGSSASLQAVPAGVVPPDRALYITATTYKRLKVAGVGNGLTVDYSDIYMTATG